METRESQPFLAFNGIQTQSAQTYSLATELAEMATLGVDLARIYPQQHGTGEVIGHLDDLLAGRRSAGEVDERLARLMPVGPCQGYWHGRAGITERTV